MAKVIKHIAVIRLSAMGDVAMTVPVLNAFSKKYPDVKITLISRPFFKPFFDAIPNVAFFAFDATKYNGLSGLLRLFGELKKLNIDAVADLHNVLRSKIITKLFAVNGIKTATVDKARSEKKAITRQTNKILKPLTPIVMRHAEVFAKLGFPINLESATLPKLEISQEILGITESRLNHKWIGIAPFAQYDSKIYPIDLMREVIEKLDENTTKIFLLGSKDEIPRLENLAKNRHNVIVIPGKFDLQNELELISNLDVLLSMDSGNAHIAAMYGIQTVTLWGATHPFVGFAPFNQPLENAIVANRQQFPMLPTSVYGSKKVNGYDDAMRTISPETVVNRINEILKN